jgi:hypothetical protein
LCAEYSKLVLIQQLAEPLRLDLFAAFVLDSIGCGAGRYEDKSGWSAFLRHLVDRGSTATICGNALMVAVLA